MLHAKALVGIDGREVAEARARANKLGLEAIDRGDLVKRGVLVVGAARADGSLDPVAAAKAHVLDHLLGNEGVVVTGHVVAGANEAIALARDVKHAGDVAEALGTRGGNVDRLSELGLADAHVLNAEVNRLATQLCHEHGGNTLARERGAAVVVARVVAVVVVAIAAAVVASVVVLELTLALRVLLVETAARANVTAVALIAALLLVSVLTACLRVGALASIGRRSGSLVTVLAGARATTRERAFVTGSISPGGDVGFGSGIRLGSSGRLRRSIGLRRGVSLGGVGPGCVIRLGGAGLGSGVGLGWRLALGWIGLGGASLGGTGLGNVSLRGGISLLSGRGLSSSVALRRGGSLLDGIGLARARTATLWCLRNLVVLFCHVGDPSNRANSSPPTPRC